MDGVSAEKLANKYNLTAKSLQDQTFLTAGDNLFGCSFGDWVDGGNHAPFNATDLENYKDCLQSDIKTVSNIYLALNRFAHPSARISLQGFLEKIYGGSSKPQCPHPFCKQVFSGASSSEDP